MSDVHVEDLRCPVCTCAVLQPIRVYSWYMFVERYYRRPVRGSGRGTF